jgi:ATP-binding cassette, subfamily B, multidrug efflux pump
MNSKSKPNSLNQLGKLYHFVNPYLTLAIVSLVLLTLQIFSDLAIPRLFQQIIDKGVKAGNINVVLQTSGWMFGLIILSTLFAVANNIYSIRVGEGVARDLREAIFVKIQSFSYGNIDRFTTGRLLVRLSSDAQAVQRVFQVTLRIGTRGPLMMIGSIILMFATSPQLAMSMVPLLLITAVIIVFFSVKMEPLFLSVQQKMDRLNTVLQENIAGARLVKAFVRANYENERFAVANQDYAQRSTNVMQFMASMSPVLTMILNIAMAMVIYFGGLRVVQGSMTVGQIIAFTQYLSTTMGPLIMMTMLANTWANGMASAGRINEVLDMQPDVQDQPGALPLPEHAEASVKLENVSFHYNGDVNNEILSQVSLDIQPGEIVAFLGATGAGKTSLVNLIPRFYDPNEGQVKINGIDIRDIQQDSLVAHVGIVPQETILFSGTVRDNIRYGRPSATDEEVEAAAKIAQAHDFILNLPQGYDTHIEERGVNLSGGQKQRVAIARALLLRPKILIFDDSTSSVDVETETKIQDGLKTIMQGHTSFIVAQRISTVLNADRIVLIDKGQIVGQGSHAELIKSNPIYQEIYESQLGNGVLGKEPEFARAERS